MSNVLYTHFWMFKINKISLITCYKVEENHHLAKLVPFDTE